MDGQETRSARHRKTLTLRDFFWLILTVAVMFGAYRWGFKAGREYQEPTETYAKVYYLPFAIDGTAAADELCELVENTIWPDSWQEVGGSGSVDYFAANNSLVVSNRQDVHVQVQDLLNQLGRLEDQATRQQPGAKSASEYLHGYFR